MGNRRVAGIDLVCARCRRVIPAGVEHGRTRDTRKPRTRQQAMMRLNNPPRYLPVHKVCP